MSNESLDNIVDFSAERTRRVHDLNEKRLQEVRGRFYQSAAVRKSSS